MQRGRQRGDNNEGRKAGLQKACSGPRYLQYNDFRPGCQYKMGQKWLNFFLRKTAGDKGSLPQSGSGKGEEWGYSRRLAGVPKTPQTLPALRPGG